MADEPLWKNAMWTADGSAIDMDLNHPKLGWIRYTASPDETDTIYGPLLYQQAAESGQVADYVPPEPETEPEG